LRDQDGGSQFKVGLKRTAWKKKANGGHWEEVGGKPENINKITKKTIGTRESIIDGKKSRGGRTNKTDFWGNLGLRTGGMGIQRCSRDE